MFDIRVASECSFEGRYNFPYLTTFIDGEEWICNNEGKPESIIGNKSDRMDSYYVVDITSFEEAQKIMEEIPYFIPDED